MEALILIICIPVVMAGAPILFVIWSRRHMWMNGTDGYQLNHNKHKDQCPCDRCLARLHRNIHRLEVELGMAEPEPPKEDKPKYHHHLKEKAWPTTMSSTKAQTGCWTASPANRQKTT